MARRRSSKSSTEVSEQRWVTLGRAIKAHGVRGELRIVVETEEAAGLVRPGLALRARGRDGSIRAITVGERVRPIHGAFLITVEELPQREDVQSLAGAALEIDASLLDLAEDPYLFELEGARVEAEDGELLGAVVQIADNGGQELLVFSTPSGEERMLPLVDATFVRFDRERDVLVIRPIAGLWEDA